MSRPLYAPLALNDLEVIAYSIAQDNPERAVTFVAELRHRAQQAADYPKVYQPRGEWMKGLRSVRHGAYLIFFVEAGDDILIARVMHGARDLQRVIWQ